jgi:hypothetical protein
MTPHALRLLTFAFFLTAYAAPLPPPPSGQIDSRSASGWSKEAIIGLSIGLCSLFVATLGTLIALIASPPLRSALKRKFANLFS